MTNEERLKSAIQFAPCSCSNGDNDDGTLGCWWWHRQPGFVLADAPYPDECWKREALLGAGEIVDALDKA